MNPDVWGPSAWLFLHSITLSYPKCPSDEDKNNMKNFFSNLGNVLPCENCRVNYASHLNKYPLTIKVLQSKQNLVKWLIDIHNSVNSMKNKPILTYEQAFDAIMSNYITSGKKSSNKYLIYGCIVVLLFVVLMLISKLF